MVKRIEDFSCRLGTPRFIVLTLDIIFGLVTNRIRRCALPVKDTQTA